MILFTRKYAGVGILPSFETGASCGLFHSGLTGVSKLALSQARYSVDFVE